MPDETHFNFVFLIYEAVSVPWAPGSEVKCNLRKKD
jgi:hypothetical protein